MIPRWLHRAWAKAFGWFWLPCPECGRSFGGHEASHVSLYMPDGSHALVCRRCASAVNERQIEEIERRLGMRS